VGVGGQNNEEWSRTHTTKAQSIEKRDRNGDCVRDHSSEREKI